ncbi:uncharacterized protein LOC141686159 [Apium graveolens]|uniref:uncharacterized protein LOC141686159 n=1 Tax=Apium graveolens TaxID=4045 RepID=UPI003D7B86FA
MRNSQGNENDSTRKCSRWTAAEDRALVNVINDLLELGGQKGDNGQFKSGAWAKVEAIMQQKLPGCDKKAKPHIESRIKLLRKQYDAIAEMLGPSASGFGWNDEGKFVTCPQSSHPNAASLRNKPFPLFDELSKIFGKDWAVGNESANAMDALEELEEEIRDGEGEQVPNFTEDSHTSNKQNRQMETPGSSTSSSVRTKKARTETIEVLKDFSSKLEKMSGVTETASEYIGRLASCFQHESDSAERRMQAFDRAYPSFMKGDSNMISHTLLFEIKKELSELVQDNLSISAYYTKFKKLYDDLLSVSNVPKCTCVCNYKAKGEIEQYEETVKVTQFLMGLSDSFTSIRGQLLMMNPMPKLTQVLGLLQQDERQRNYSHLHNNAPESAMLMTKNVSSNFNNRFAKSDVKKFVPNSDQKNNRFQSRKGTLECTHCNGTNHTRDICYHLIRFPPRNKPSQKFNKTSTGGESRMIAQVHSGNTNVSTTVKADDTGKSSTSNSNLTLEQYQQLMALSNQANSIPSTVEPPQSGINSMCSSMTTVCVTGCYNSADWILDSGATDHITCQATLLVNPITYDIKISLPNGQVTTVHYKGQVSLTSDIVLTDVLLIHEFQFNLIYVSQLSKHLNYEAHFNSHHCVIQAPMKRVMGIVHLFPPQNSFVDDIDYVSPSSSATHSLSETISSNSVSPDIMHSPEIVSHSPSISENTLLTVRDSVGNNHDQQNNVRITRSVRSKQIPQKFSDYVGLPSIISGKHVNTVSYPIQYVDSVDHLSPSYQSFIANSIQIPEPTYKQAITDPLWCTTMQAELNALELNQTWKIVDLPPNKRVVGCKWIYKVKYNTDGTLDRYKARLVAKGFTQTQGVDFFQTYAPVAKMTTVRTLLSLAAIQNWTLHQLDINNAFLNGDLHEEIFMQTFIALLVYVDDIILTGSNETTIKEVKGFIQSQFKLKDLGHLHYFLAIEIARSSQGIYLHQRKYALNLLNQTGLLASKPRKITIATRHNLHNLSGTPLIDGTSYRRLVGQLIYLTITRPELSYPVHILSQFMAAPTDQHWNAAIKLIKYLKQAPGQGILLSASSPLELKVFCDADWASCPMTRRSLSGFCVMLGNSLLSWKCKKQNIVAR